MRESFSPRGRQPRRQARPVTHPYHRLGLSKGEISPARELAAILEREGSIEKRSSKAHARKQATMPASERPATSLSEPAEERRASTARTSAWVNGPSENNLGRQQGASGTVPEYRTNPIFLHSTARCVREAGDVQSLYLKIGEIGARLEGTFVSGLRAGPLRNDRFAKGTRP